MTETRSHPRICLAASGGGHMRQVLDLKPFWQGHDHYLVTEPTALGQSLASEHPVHFVAHFAYGQSKVDSAWALIRSGFRNMRESWAHVRAERPDVVISTGAGSAFFTALFAKLFGAKFVFIESFARFRGPSLFGRMARLFADKLIVQSEAVKAMWPEAEACDPLRILGTGRPDKEPLAFVTVGTVMPFDRLVNAVADLRKSGALPERVIAQVGDGGVRPEGMEVHERMAFDDIQAILQKADIVFCHGGTGSLVTALRAGCRVVAMPRQSARAEHYDDHQEEIVSAFEQRGLIQAAVETGDMAAALARARAIEPIRATTEPELLIGKLHELMAEWFPKAKDAKSLD